MKHVDITVAGGGSGGPAAGTMGRVEVVFVGDRPLQVSVTVTGRVSRRDALASPDDYGPQRPDRTRQSRRHTVTARVKPT
jgi:hypothetical protein